MRAMNRRERKAARAGAARAAEPNPMMAHAAEYHRQVFESERLSILYAGLAASASRRLALPEAAPYA
jgi:hypothetical protein